MTTAFLGLGSNRGDRLETLTSCLFVLDETDGITVEDVSGVYETAPWGRVEQEPFLNLCAKVTTTLTAGDLLRECHAIEAAFGRDRDAEQRWGARTLDIDLLLYGDEVVDEPGLVVPHARITERAFVLVPLMEVNPGGTLPDGTRLTTALTALAPVTGIDLFIRLSDVPGTAAHAERPAGPPSDRPIPAAQWQAPTGAPPDAVVE